MTKATKESKLPKGWCEVHISMLVKADWNYKKDSYEVPMMRDALKKNMMRNGQIENILIRELDTGFYEVVNGNHRYDAMVELEIQTVHCYNLGKVSLAHAQRVAVETNETKFPHDHSKLAGVINEISQEFDISELTETMPYTTDELTGIIDVGNFDFGTYTEHDQDSYIIDRTSKYELKLEFTDADYKQRYEDITAQLETVGAFSALEEVEGLKNGDKLVLYLNDIMRCDRP